MFKFFSPDFWQSSVSPSPKKAKLPKNPHNEQLERELRGLPKSALTKQFAEIGVTDETVMAIKPEIGIGEKVTLRPFKEIKDDWVYVGRLAKNHGAGAKGRMHAFQDPNPS